jgi:transposase
MERDLGAKDCPGCRAFERLVEQLQEQVRGLQQRLEQAERDGKRQTVRFRRRKRVAEPKKPGRRRGHPATFRERTAPPDRVIEAPVGVCPDCQVPLQNVETHRQFQTDLPPVRPKVTQFNVQVGTCPHCQKRVQGRHPAQTSDALGAARETLGPNVHALASTLKYGAGMSWEKISRFVGEFFGLRVAASTFVRASQRMAGKAQPTWHELRRKLRRSDCVHGDETGWRIGTASAWLWVFASDAITLFDIDPSRGHEVILRMLGEDFSGVLSSDGFCAYDVPAYVKLRCNGHVLRRVSGLKETVKNPVDLDWLEEIETLFRESADLRARHELLTRRGYWRRVREIENRFDHWLARNTKSGHEDLQRLARHLADHRHEWLLYLYNPELPTTNNLGERQIRPGVMTRKVGGCNKTARGTFATKTFASLLATCRQQGRSYRALLTRLLHARAPTPVHFTCLPAL